MVRHDEIANIGKHILTESIYLKDSYSGADFAKKEVQDEYGVVTGEYR